MLKRVLFRVPEYFVAYFAVAAICYAGEWVSLYVALRKRDRERAAEDTKDLYEGLNQ